MVSIVSNETKQFVEFNDADIIVVKENDYTSVTLPFQVLEDYHIQSNLDVANGSIATKITFKESNDYRINSQEIFLIQEESIVLNGDKYEIISNQFKVTVRLKLDENASNVKLEGELYYQACTDRQCLFPRALNFKISL